MPCEHELAEAGDAPVVAAKAPVVAEPDAGEIDAAAERLCEGERPLVLAGRGAFPRGRRRCAARAGRRPRRAARALNYGYAILEVEERGRLGRAISVPG
jgi:thiamine pyrophosphate-dependent acetolactate synthase large subunit-like protein